MDILALETSSASGSAALWRDGQLVDVRTFQSERAHNAVLFKPLETILKQVEDLELVVVGTGPGSYTGVRVGIAAALGISLGRGVPLIGLPSIGALAHTMGLDRYAVCGDARRGAWWWAQFESGKPTLPPVAAPLEETTARAAAWTGHVFTVDAVSPPFCTATPTFPKAEILATAAGGLSEDAVTRLAAQPVEPIYLAAPYITVSKQPVFA
jgi:tRNA threonylcarbamoyl adenosine modification protein YeaZ